MFIIVLASQKGGAGKTTLTGHLAVQAQLAGAGKVALIDTDPQGSLSDWWNAREKAEPLFVNTTYSRLLTDLQQLQEQGVEYVFIDTPPAMLLAIRQVLAHADLVVVPTRPSPHDLRAVASTLALVEDVGKRFVFVVNAATPRARITAEAAIALSQHGTVAPSVVHQRTNFASSMIDGQTVMEVEGDGKSAKEIAELWDYLVKQLDKVQRPNLMQKFKQLVSA